MQEVSAASERTDAASGQVLASADGVAHDADTLRGEVTRFPQVMASTEEADQRGDDRIPVRAR